MPHDVLIDSLVAEINDTEVDTWETKARRLRTFLRILRASMELELEGYQETDWEQAYSDVLESINEVLKELA